MAVGVEDVLALADQAEIMPDWPAVEKTIA
jgi:hypothetical protein